MPGVLTSWPEWQEFEHQYNHVPKDPDFGKAKQSIIDKYGEAALTKSWLQVCEDLVNITNEIAEKQSSIIPVLSTDDILQNGFSDAQAAEIKRIGCFIAQGTIPRDETNKAYTNLQQYVADNREHVSGWPEATPSMLMLYDSPTQITLRTHPRQLRLQRRINALWHDGTCDVAAEPLLYSDGIRDRPPGQRFLGLGPHIDAGSLCRWACPDYQKTYGEIFSGSPRSHDAFDLSIRKTANQTLFPGIAHSQIFRSFQGWTALTRAAASEGAIMLYPNVKTAIAYVLLRPFFAPPPDPADVLNASKWTFDRSGAWFPGTCKPDSQSLSRTSHPHLRLEECLVHIPDMAAGDTVWWHTDVSSPRVLPTRLLTNVNSGLSRGRSRAQRPGERLGGVHSCLSHDRWKPSIHQESTPSHIGRSSSARLCSRMRYE